MILESLNIIVGLSQFEVCALPFNGAGEDVSYEAQLWHGTLQPRARTVDRSQHDVTLPALSAHKRGPQDRMYAKSLTRRTFGNCFGRKVVRIIDEDRL